MLGRFFINKYYFIHTINFLLRAMRILKFPYRICRYFNDKYHHFVFNKLMPYFIEVYKKFIVNTLNSQYNSGINKTNIIWIFWWQGKEHMPPIVKACMKSVIRNSKNYKVILITKNNIKKYSNIPNYIYLKLFNKDITFTHFSDILRFNLLYNHGGIWMDSTIYCTSTIPKLYGTFYTSGGYYDKYHAFVSPKWTGFLIGGNKGNPIFLFMTKFFEEYWEHNIRLIDYFLIDYGLDFIYKKNIGYFKNYVNEIACKNNPQLYKLCQLLNHGYNSNIFKRITENTNLFKLTYKMRFRNKSDTFYHELFKFK